GGTNRHAATTTKKQPTATASWTFTGLGSGPWDVYVTYFGLSGYSTAAPVTIYDGVTKLSTTVVNESILGTQSHGGRAQGSYGGVGWLALGTFIPIQSGTLEVVLGNNASGSKVDADGVLIVNRGAAAAAALGIQPPGPAVASTRIAAGLSASSAD